MTTGIAGNTARQNIDQEVHYLRFAVAFSDVGLAAGIGKQWLPAGAIIIGTDVVIETPFNAGTTNVLTVGTDAPNYANLVGAADVDESVAALTQNIKPTGAALGALPAAAQVFVKYAQTGAAASAGKAYVIVKYVPNNDL